MAHERLFLSCFLFVLYKKLWNWKANGSSIGLRDVPWREICEEWGDCCDSQIARWMPQSVGRRAHRVQDSKAPPREWLPNIATKNEEQERREPKLIFLAHSSSPQLLLLLLTLIKKALHGTKFFFLWCCHSIALLLARFSSDCLEGSWWEPFKSKRIFVVLLHCIIHYALSDENKWIFRNLS